MSKRMEPERAQPPGGRPNRDTAVVYFDERAAKDSELASATLGSLQELLRERPEVKWPDTEEPVGAGYYGNHCDAPSIVWHAQALASLLEVGLAPWVDSVGVHRGILERRLNYPAVADSPEDEPPSDWVLRTRHVALALDALAEFDAGAIDAAQLPAELRPRWLTPEREQALAAHRRTAEIALEHLMGDGAPWIGISDEELFWPEYWGAKRPNLLNTVYSSTGILKAHRHGLRVLRSMRSAWDSTATVEDTVRRFIGLVEVEPTQTGPRTRIRGDWVEPWSTCPKPEDDLPCSVVGLLALLLCEYDKLLTAQEGNDRMKRRAQHGRVLASRLGNELLRRSDEWTSHIEGFSYGQAGWWYVPAYSVCLRAVLETRVANIHDQAVHDALVTIDHGSRERPYGHTWVDPTRRGTLDERVTPGQANRWFASHDVAEILRDRRAKLPSTASSVWAAVMPLAAVQRTAESSDPRRLHERSRAASSPFTHIDLHPLGGARWQLTARVHNIYAERAMIRHGTVHVLDALAEKKSATGDEIVAWVNERVPENGAKVTRTAEGVRKAVDRLNNQLGVDIVQKKAVTGVSHEYSLNAALTNFGAPNWSSREFRTGS